MKRERRSIRLKEYDYSRDGAYFMTICTQNRECLFGEIADGAMVLNKYGKIVRDEWLKSARIRNEIELDEFVVMPNHFHGIVRIHNGVETINDCRGDRPYGAAPPFIGFVDGRFQIRRDPSHQRNAPHPRREIMATELL